MHFGIDFVRSSSEKKLFGMGNLFVKRSEFFSWISGRNHNPKKMNLEAIFFIGPDPIGSGHGQPAGYITPTERIPGGIPQTALLSTGLLFFEDSSQDFTDHCFGQLIPELDQAGDLIFTHVLPGPALNVLGAGSGGFFL